jgi:hypothetical protein
MSRIHNTDLKIYDASWIYHDAYIHVVANRNVILACLVLSTDPRYFFIPCIIDINYIDTKAKCRHLKNLPVKGFCGRCLSEFIDWRYVQPSFANVNCCPSPFSLVELSPLPLFSSYERAIGKMDKHLPQSHFTGQFFR